jgi:hypothetical protein
MPNVYKSLDPTFKVIHNYGAKCSPETHLTCPSQLLFGDLGASGP